MIDLLASQQFQQTILCLDISDSDSILSEIDFFNNI